MITTTKITDDPDKPKAEITIDNGDLAALEDARNKWRFQNEANMLRFMVAILRESKDHAVYIKDDNGKMVAFAPAENLLTPPDKNGKEDATTEPDDAIGAA